MESKSPHRPICGDYQSHFQVTHIKNRVARVHLSQQLSALYVGLEKKNIFFFPETFYGNSELLINGNIQRCEAFWTFLSMLIKTTASALPRVFQNNRSADLLREPMANCFTTLILWGDSVVYQLGNTWHAKIFYRQLLRNI